MPAPAPRPDAGLRWDRVTEAFDAELRAWDVYAADARAWADALRADVEAGRPPSEAHVRVGACEAPEALLERTDWVAEQAESVARALREALAAGDIDRALLVVVQPGPGARGLDFRAPGFFLAASEPGDLRPLWSVSDRARVDLLRETFWPDAPPAWFLDERPRWARPLYRAFWSPYGDQNMIVPAYEAHLRTHGNPWAAAS